MKKIFMLFLCSLLLIVFAFAGMIEESSSSGAGAGSNGDNEFILQIVEANYKVKDKYDVLTSITVAQAIEESGWGESNLAVNANNLFGMKGSYLGNYYEGSDGTKWRKYSSWEESIEDHARILCNSRYQCEKIKDYNEVISRLEEGGYSENASYGKHIKSHIENYDLTQYDDLTNEQLVQVINRTYQVVGGSYDNYEPNGDSRIGNAIVKTALSKCGSRYVWGASGPDTFDCSGLVYWACRQNGVVFGRTTASVLSTMGTSVSINELQPGDIITFKTHPPKVSHVGIYIGDGKMVHAPHTGDVVKVVNVLDSKYWKKVIHNCRRLY